MPNSVLIKAILQSYIDTFNKGDAQAVAALFADDATVEDPVGSLVKQGREELLAFYKNAIATGAKLTLDAPIRASHGEAGAMAFTAQIGQLKVRVIDVMTINDAGKITSMKAYFGPDDIIQPIKDSHGEADAMAFIAQI